jgi:hypothetical protein
MKKKDRQRRESDLVEPSNLLRSVWVSVGVSGKWEMTADWFHKQGGRDVGIGEGPKVIVYPARVILEVKEPTAYQNAPAIAEALLVLFCPRNRIDALMGDLEERFHEHIRMKGKRRAKLLYWAAVLRSIVPLLWVKVRKAGWIALLFEIRRRWGGLS